MSGYKFRFIDLFAGIGGFHQAMTLYGGECVFASEIDEECQRQYRTQFRMDIKGDINKYVNDIPSFDVLCGGFPCQTFSKAGLQEGFDNEEKGKLFFKIVEILKLHPECKFIILENVRNLADDEKFWNVIQKNLRSLDFYITQDPIILSPDDFGIPQNRERVYILGIKKSLRDVNKLKNGWIHTEDLHLEQYLKKCKDTAAFDILEDDVDNVNYIISKEENAVLNAWEEFKREIIPHEQIGAPIWLDFFGINQDDDFFYLNSGYDKQLVKATKKDKINPTKKDLIDENGFILEDTPLWKKRFIDKNRQLYKKYKNEIDAWYCRHQQLLGLKIYRKFEYNCGIEYESFQNLIIQFRQSGLRIKKPNKFPSLVAIVNTPIIWDQRFNAFRRITVREAANLQSFRKNYNFVCENGVSYKQLGNSVNVRVIKIIAKQLFDLGITGWCDLEIK